MTFSEKVDVVTIGESLVLFHPSIIDGPIKHSPFFSKSVGGAESNVGLVLNRLGKKVRWISRLGNDPFGDFILSTIAGEGLDVSHVIKDDKAPTAIYFKESKPYGDPNVYYYRKESAASKFSKEDIKKSWFSGAKHLHMTGITPALGDHTKEMVCEVMKEAKRQGLTISFDPNLREKLWDEKEARDTLLSLIPYCDIFLPGIGEAKFLLGEKSIEEYCKAFSMMGPKIIALKLGDKGSVAYFGNNLVRMAPYLVDSIVDTVGAGDSYAAGFLSILLNDEVPLEEDDELEKIIPNALRRANILGALATQFQGDWEGAITLDELKEIEASDGF